MEKYFTNYIDSPVGWLKIKTDEFLLLEIKFVDKEGISEKDQPEILNQTIKQLTEYFQGNRKEFNLNINPSGTDFQKKTWIFVSKIPFGETATYLEIAKQTGSNKNTRAVGTSNGKNPIPIIIPCHRIIGSNGKLTGYAGGIERKRWLLQHELIHSEKTSLLF